MYSLQETNFNADIGNNQYRKIVKSGLDLIALTWDGRVKALTSYPMFIGIFPENFIFVDDILIDNNDELGIPVVVKNGIKIPLYIC